MKKAVIFMAALVLICFATACGTMEQDTPDTSTSQDDVQTDTTDENASDSSESTDMALNIKVGDRVFSVTLYDNPSTQALIRLLPLTLDMSEMNGNEKYFFLQDDLPTDSENVGSIREGDFMLYGNNCLVLFYKDFSTSYRYTPLGRLNNPEGFAEAVGSGDIAVEFSNLLKQFEIFF